MREFLRDEDAIGHIEGDRFVVLHRILGEGQIVTDEQEIVNSVRNYFVNRGDGNRLQVCSGVYILTPKDYQVFRKYHLTNYAIYNIKNLYCVADDIKTHT